MYDVCSRVNFISAKFEETCTVQFASSKPQRFKTKQPLPGLVVQARWIIKELFGERPLQVLGCDPPNFTHMHDDNRATFMLEPSVQQPVILSAERPQVHCNGSCIYEVWCWACPWKMKDQEYLSQKSATACDTQMSMPLIEAARGVLLDDSSAERFIRHLEHHLSRD